MLIAKMGTTYDSVLEHEERNVLGMKTSVFFEQGFILDVVAKLHPEKKGYRYIAKHI